MLLIHVSVPRLLRTTTDPLFHGPCPQYVPCRLPARCFSGVPGCGDLTSLRPAVKSWTGRVVRWPGALLQGHSYPAWNLLERCVHLFICTAVYILTLEVTYTIYSVKRTGMFQLRSVCIRSESWKVCLRNIRMTRRSLTDEKYTIFAINHSIVIRSLRGTYCIVVKLGIHTFSSAFELGHGLPCELRRPRTNGRRDFAY